MTGQIRKAVRKRDRLLKTYSKCKSPTSWDRYRVQRNLVVRKARINFNMKTNLALSDSAIPSKKWWRIVKSMYGNKCYAAIPAISEGDVFISDSKEKVNVFNDYFASQATVTNSDSAEIPFLPRWSSESLSVITADEEMLRNLMSSVDISKATGYDGISSKIIRLCSEGKSHIRHPLSKEIILESVSCLCYQRYYAESSLSSGPLGLCLRLV